MIINEIIFKIQFDLSKYVVNDLLRIKIYLSKFYMEKY